MKLIKQIITDAKKQKAMVQGKQQKEQTVPKIEIEECQTLYIDEKIFEYDMIHRARKAELLLNEILANYHNAKYKKISLTMDHLLTKFKIKSTSTKNKEIDVPKILIIDCDDCEKKQQEGEQNVEMDYEKLFQQATEAQIYLEQLLNNNYESGSDSESSSEEMTDCSAEHQVNNKPKLHRGSPSKRISYTGETYNLEKSICKHKKRKIVLEFSELRRITQYKKDYNTGLPGIEGRYICKEM